MSAKPAETVPQEHGGALLRGGKKGNKGGPGRPTNALRAKMFGLLEARVGLAGVIADGEPTETLELTVAQIAPHVECPNCKAKLAEVSDKAGSIRLTLKGSASARDRLASLEYLTRYTMPPLKGVDEEDVVDRMGRSLDIIKELVSAEQFERIVTAMAPLWK